MTLSSRLRPIMTMRPGYLVYSRRERLGDARLPGGFSSDGLAESQGFGFDVLTDEDLDREAVGALSLL